MTTKAKRERYEVRLWRVVNGMRLGKDVVYVDATSDDNAKRNGEIRMTNLRKPPEGVTYKAIDAKLV